ncbi:type II toxin-antitoxin system VapC family toxin [Propioniferax innocua]|uniref:Ribonuclease VapC n=1 Tax=Propioniferax innocua TaxID=1753 RepID=A0A542ZC21_9ACTN|nr:type II toxin-antitoxin system VapC family toxin [Propioniferax innocua]TQL57800.1 putative nucleic acid-binding protein [Propioniferax innocua]
MIVIDASAMVEALVGASPSDELLDALTQQLHAPNLLDVEVTSVLRGLELGRVLPRDAALTGLRDYWDFSIVRHNMEPLTERIWSLRHQFTSYDSFYLALAEALDAPLLTCDRKLTASGHTAHIQLVGRSSQ